MSRAVTSPAALEAFKRALAERAAEAEAELELALSPAKSPATGADSPASPAPSHFLSACPPRLLAAMRHGVFNGGKRLRPFLLMESAALLAPQTPQKQQAARQAAAALEAVHCYSLIHDDLPAMDNDDWRRGKPTVHKAYDEATAILAGNALFTLAFQMLAAAESLAPSARMELCGALAAAAGGGGMIGGQMLDIEGENTAQSEAQIRTMEAMKTGALLRFACFGGAIIAEAGAENRALMAEFGARIGLAFQLADDLLDSSGSSAALGKTPGKDAAAGKATLPALYGEAKTRALLAEEISAAQDMLAPFGAKADILRAAAAYIAARSH